MDEFDPIPPVNPVFKGVVVATLLALITLALTGVVALAVAVLT